MPYPRDNKDNQIPTLCPAPPLRLYIDRCITCETGQTDETLTRLTQSTHVYMCHATSFMRTRDLWCNRLGKVSNFTRSNALFSIPSANLRFLTFLALKFWFRASENVKWKSRNVVEFVSLTGWWAVTINESLPFGISLPLPAIILRSRFPPFLLPSPVPLPHPVLPGSRPPVPPHLITFIAFSSFISSKFHFPHKLFISHTNSFYAWATREWMRKKET